MYKKGFNRTNTFSGMMVFESHERISELKENLITDLLMDSSQKPKCDCVKNKNCRNLQLPENAFILGSEEKIPEMNLPSVSILNRSWQNRFCISVSKKDRQNILHHYLDYCLKQSLTGKH